MRYEEPKLRILLMNVENVIRTSPGVEEGDGIPDLDQGDYQNN